MKSLGILIGLLITTGALASSSTSKQIDNIYNSSGGSSIAVPGSGSTFATDSNTLTLTNKTISGASNTISNISASNISGGTLAVNYGGTGANTLTAHAVLIGEGTSAVAFASPTQYESLIGNASGDPSFQAVPLNQSAAVSGQLAVGNGGTGDSSLTSNGILYGNGSSAVQVTAAGSQYQSLQAGSGGTPAFGAVALNQSAAVSGQLATGNGGTGLNGITAHNLIVGNGSSAANLIAPGTSGYVLTSNGASSDPSFQAIPSMAPSLNGGSASPQSVTASGGVSLSSIGYSNFAWLVGSPGAVTVTATPSVTACTADGQRLTLIGTDNTKTVTLQDQANLSGSGLSMNGNIVLAKDSVIEFHCDITQGLWIEDNRRQ